MNKPNKFISREKLSKKKRRELDLVQRNTWGSMKPVSRIHKDKTVYTRKRKHADRSYNDDMRVFYFQSIISPTGQWSEPSTSA